MSIRFAIALSASVAVAFAAAGSAHADDRSLRIGTFNAYMKPPLHAACLPLDPVACTLVGGRMQLDPSVCFPTANCEIGWNEAFDDGSTITQGAQRLADRILASDYDVVIIEEAWWDDAQTVLRNALLPTYTNAVTLIDDPIVKLTNSGLMLFAKPHLLLQDVSAMGCGDCTDPDGSCAISANKDSGGAAVPVVPANDFVLFESYDDTTGPDSWANKGVAFVRLRDGNTGMFYDVFFTHTNATYSDELDNGGDLADLDSCQARESQMTQIKQFYSCVTGAYGTTIVDPALDTVILAGDLNIDGDPTNTEDAYSGVDAWNNKGEWSRYMDPAVAVLGGFFANTLQDDWMFSNLQRDVAAGLLASAEPGISYPLDEGCFSTPSYLSTTSDPGCRMDYILTNRPIHNESDNPTCNQHMTMAVNLQDSDMNLGGIGFGGHTPGAADGMGGTSYQAGWYSDHIGVNANYARLAPQCSPLDPVSAAAVYHDASAGIVALTDAQIGVDSTGAPIPSNPGGYLSGTITNQGNVQWWRLDRSGDFLIGLGDDKNGGGQGTTDKGFHIEVFQHDDLSVPVKGYKNELYSKKLSPASGRGFPETITGKKYELLDPPYYIKIYNEDVATTGAYQFGVHALSCGNKGEEACIVTPNTKLGGHTFPAQSFASTPTLESMYFQLDVQQPTALTDQDLTFIVSDAASALHLELALVTTANDTPIVPVATGCGAPVNGDYTGCNQMVSVPGWSAPLTKSGDRLYMRVRRTPSSSTTAGPFAVTWWTNLTAFFGGGYSQEDGDDVTLRCIQENDWSARDEIKMRARVDATMWLGPDDDTNGFWIAHLDEDGDAVSSKRIDGDLADGTGFDLPYLFTDELRLDVVENEGACDDDCTCTIDDVVCAVEEEHRYAVPLDPSLIGPDAAQLRDELDYEWTPNEPDDGYYELTYNLNHGTQAWDPPKQTIVLPVTSSSLWPAAYSTTTQSGKALDGDTTTFAATTAAAGAYWKADLGASRYVATVQITNVPASPPTPGTNLSNFEVEASLDGSNWTAITPFVFPGTMTAGTTQSFQMLATARYIRVRNLGTSVRSITPAEIKIKGW